MPTPSSAAAVGVHSAKKDSPQHGHQRRAAMLLPGASHAAHRALLRAQLGAPSRHMMAKGSSVKPVMAIAAPPTTASPR